MNRGPYEEKVNTQIRKLLLRLGIVLAAVAGLLTVSALVPDVGCKKRTPDILVTFTRIRVWLPERVQVGQSFSVTGTLERGAYPGVALPPAGGNEKYAEPFPQQRIIVRSSFFAAETITDDQGRFSCNITPRVPGKYMVVAKYPGDSMMYYHDSTDGREVLFTGEEVAVKPIDLSWLRYVLIIPMALVVAYILYSRLRTLSRRNKGQRKHDSGGRGYRELLDLLPWALALLVLAAILYALVPRGPRTEREAENAGRIPTSIRLTVPSRVKQDESFAISGRLYSLQRESGMPMQGAKIDIFVVATSGQFDVQAIVATVTTDGSGQFNSQTSIQYSGVYEVSAVFRDTGDIYLESSDVRNVRVGGPGEIFGDWRSPGWFSVILGVPLALLLAVGGFLYYRHYRKTHVPEAKGSAAPRPRPAPLPPPPSPAQPSLPESPVRIRLPQIIEPFPDVWGRDDSLLVVFTLDATRHPLVQYSLDIELGHATARVPVGQEGRVSQEHTFRQEGEYQIKAALVREVRNGYRAALRVVRIVDYREEIVRLYNEIIPALRARGVDLRPELTPREVRSQLRRSMPDLPPDAAAQLAAVFEEANYSMHKIGRADYERMYIACAEVGRQVPM